VKVFPAYGWNLAAAAMFGFHIESHENEAFGVQIAIQSNAQSSV
jgi:hypothetical protein